MTKNNKLSLVAAAVLLVPFAAQAASTTTTTFQVTVSVAASCSVAATDIDFGTYNPLSATALTQTGSVSPTCTSGTPYTVALNAGANSAGSFANRVMIGGAGGTDTLDYNLYTDSAYTNVWGDGTGSTLTVAGTGNGSAQPISVYAKLPGSQSTATTGSYADTVTVTVSY